MAILVDNLQNRIEVNDNMNGLLSQAAELCLKLEGFDVPSEISFLLVDNDRIREMNKEYRDVDASTDVLSFPMADISEGELNSREGDIDFNENLLLLGDVVISLETAKKQAAEYGHSFERELAFLATHGIFHLLGYDHMDSASEEKMMGKQEAVLKQMGLER